MVRYLAGKPNPPLISHLVAIPHVVSKWRCHVTECVWQMVACSGRWLSI